MLRVWLIWFSPFRAIDHGPMQTPSESHRLSATFDSFLQLPFNLNCLFLSVFFLFFLGGGVFHFLRVFFFFVFSVHFIIIFCLLVFSLFFYFNYTSWLLESSWQFRGSKRPKTSGTNTFPSWRRMTLGFLVGVWHICLFALPTWTSCLPSSTTDASLRSCHLSCTGPCSPFPCHQSLASSMAASTTHTSQSWTCTPSSLLPPEESQ